MLKKVVLLRIFVETMIIFFRIGKFNEQKVKKNCIYLKRTDFIKVFTVTFVQCNASFMKVLISAPKLLNGNPIIIVMNTYTAIFRRLTSLALFLVLSHILCQFVLYSSICKRHLFACLAACCSGSSAVT